MSSVPPIFCGTVLAAVIAAGASHFWSVDTFVSNYPVMPSFRLLAVDIVSPAPDVPAPSIAPALAAPPVATAPPAAQTQTQVADSSTPKDEPHSAEFFEKLIQELRNLRNENQALNNQIAETNRDVMKMQFQIDTHSESFRPLPASQSRGDTTYGLDYDLPGVLPPRAEPVYQADQ